MKLRRGSEYFIKPASNQSRPKPITIAVEVQPILNKQLAARMTRRIEVLTRGGDEVVVRAGKTDLTKSRIDLEDSGPDLQTLLGGRDLDQ